MEGVPNDVRLRGIMPNSFNYIVEAVAGAGKNTQFLVRMSFLEIYKVRERVCMCVYVCVCVCVFVCASVFPGDLQGQSTFYASDHLFW
jgi:hypothetical protein